MLNRPGVIAREYEGKALLFWDGLPHRQSGGSIVRLTFNQDTPQALREGLELALVSIAKMAHCLGGGEDSTGGTWVDPRAKGSYCKAACVVGAADCQTLFRVYMATDSCKEPVET